MGETWTCLLNNGDELQVNLDGDEGSYTERREFAAKLAESYSHGTECWSAFCENAYDYPGSPLLRIKKHKIIQKYTKKK